MPARGPGPRGGGAELREAAADARPLALAAAEADAAADPADDGAALLPDDGAVDAGGFALRAASGASDPDEQASSSAAQAPATTRYMDARVSSVAPEDVRLTAWVRGRVQGVGFRWATLATAKSLGLDGRAANLDDGRVEVVAEGPRPACEQLLVWLEGPDTPGRVTGVSHLWSVPRGGGPGFREA